jgi:hypothetical protein
MRSGPGEEIPLITGRLHRVNHSPGGDPNDPGTPAGRCNRRG